MTRARNGYTVDDYGPTRTGVRWTLATDSEDDPSIVVDESDDGARTYTYGDGSAVECSRHRRVAAGVIAAYMRAK